MAWAVRAITGILRVLRAALSCKVASQPSTTGRLISMRIRSGVGGKYGCSSRYDLQSQCRDVVRDGLFAAESGGLLQQSIQTALQDDTFAFAAHTGEALRAELFIVCVHGLGQAIGVQI